MRSIQLPKGSVPPWTDLPDLITTPWPRLPLSTHRVNAERAGYYAYRNPEGLLALTDAYTKRVFLTPPVAILPKVPRPTVVVDQMTAQDVEALTPYDVTPDGRWVTNLDLVFLWNPSMEYTVRTTPVYVNVPVGLLNFLPDKEWTALRKAGHIIPAFAPGMPLSCPFRYPLTPANGPAIVGFNYMRTGALVLAERSGSVPMLVSRQMAAAMGIEFRPHMDMISVVEYLGNNVPEYDPGLWSSAFKANFPTGAGMKMKEPSTDALATLASTPLFPGFVDGGLNHNTYVAPWQMAGDFLKKDAGWKAELITGEVYQNEEPVMPRPAILQSRRSAYVKETALTHPHGAEPWWTEIDDAKPGANVCGYRRDGRGARL